MEKMIHVVNQTHWDREWYFSTCDSVVLMDHTFTNILDEVESNEKISFCLDGQISIVQEYLELHPEKKELIKQLVKEKRLFIGPWYTQTDTQLISSVSIINNMYYGMYDSLQIGNRYMNVAYLPDTFGFSNQIPMICHQFDIHDFIFWRGIDFDKQKVPLYFLWKGQDESVVTTANLPKGYSMAQGLNTDELFIKNIFNPILERYSRLTDTKDVLLPVGGDQNNIVKNIDEKIKKLPGQFKLSNYEDFMNTIKDQVHEEYIGEFRESKDSRLHKSAGSIRVGIKNSNYLAEMSLLKGFEPLNIMAQKEGFGMSQQLISKAWKLLFEGQAHDGIVGCVTDNVTEDIYNRNKKALEISQSAQNIIKKHFAWAMDLQKDEVIIFNTLPYAFKGYKTIEIVSHDDAITIDDTVECTLIESRLQKGNPRAMVETPNGVFYVEEEDYYYHKIIVKVDLPSFGYKVFHFHKVQKESPECKDIKISNQDYQISYINNQVILEYKGNTIHDFISLVDMANDGDTYDFSPLRDDQEIKLKINGADVRKYRDAQIMELDCSTELPYDLVDRKNNEKTHLCHCKLIIKLLKNEMIYVDVLFDNQVLSHRLRLKIKGPHIERQTIAATPGGYIIRDVGTIDIHSDWQNEYVEYPVDIETNSGFVGFYGQKEQLVVFNKGIKEYQAIDDSIYMTLFATCGELGKPDLLYRPGRASGETTRKGHTRIYTPLAQELYKHHYEVAISLLKPKVDNMYLLLQQFEEANIFYQLQDINFFVERIDNKIKRYEETNIVIPKQQSYLELPQDIYVYNTYTSLYNQNVYTRFMIFKDQNVDELFDRDVIIGNLLEKKQDERLKAMRIYTVRRKNNEDK